MVEMDQYGIMKARPMMIAPYIVKSYKNGFIDFTGKTIGDFTVLGMSFETKSSWVCKCVCGNYVYRKSKTLKSQDAINKCVECVKFEALKRRTGNTNWRDSVQDYKEGAK